MFKYLDKDKNKVYKNRVRLGALNLASVHVRVNVRNPVMTFPIKKRIYAELFIDERAALYIGENWIRVVTNEGYQRVETS